jgi:hypothetical protein
MNWLVFAAISTFVVLGIRRLSKEAKEGVRFTKTPAKDAITAQEMIQCPICNAYVIKTAMHCGREDCPYPKAGE